jgi:hypothetical protein
VSHPFELGPKRGSTLVNSSLDFKCLTKEDANTLTFYDMTEVTALKVL